MYKNRLQQCSESKKSPTEPTEQTLKKPEYQITLATQMPVGKVFWCRCPESGVDFLMHENLFLSDKVDVLMCQSICLFSCFCSFWLLFVSVQNISKPVHQLSQRGTSVYKPKIVLMSHFSTFCMISAKGGSNLALEVQHEMIFDLSYMYNIIIFS